MKLTSKTISIRLITEDDADFVVKLRTNEKYNKFLSPTSDNIEAQKKWIRTYKIDEQNEIQFYFIIERNDGTPCGTVRIYDLKPDSFCWGSWILNEDKTKYAALESAFLVYEFGFEKLNLSKSHFDVRKENEKVISFHKKMGAVKVGETDLDELFEINKASVDSIKERLLSKLK